MDTADNAPDCRDPRDALPGQVTEILAAVRMGRTEAVGDLYRYIQARLHAQAHLLMRRFRKVGSSMEADDIVSELWPKLERALLPVNPANSQELLRLASRKMHRLLLDWARRAAGPKARVFGEPTELTDITVHAVGGRIGLGIPTWVSETEQVDLLLKAIDVLDAEGREIVDYRFYQDMAIPDIAGLLGVSEKTVDRRLARVVVALNNHMKVLASEARG